MSVNKVILVGNLGKDVEVRTFGNGGRVCSFRLATSESWKDKVTGERKEKTEWHSVSIFSEGLVKVAERYLRKGSKVYLQGSLETRKYQDSSGVERWSTEVVLRNFGSELVLLDARSSGDSVSAGLGGASEALNAPSGGTGSWGNPNGTPAARELDDVIPF